MENHQKMIKQELLLLEIILMKLIIFLKLMEKQKKIKKDLVMIMIAMDILVDLV